MAHRAIVETHQIGVPCQCPKREEGAVAMVAEIEDARKADRVVEFLVPFGAVTRYRLEMGDTAQGRVVTGLACGHQGE